MAGRRRKKGDPSQSYVAFICGLYGDRYDDREEDAAPGGADWKPGTKARHKSLNVFQRELAEQEIYLSSSKIRKILITGGRWTTEGTREADALYERFTSPIENGGEGLSGKEAVQQIAAEMEISRAMVCMLLPYGKVVYDLEEKTANARRCGKWRSRKKTG